MNHICYAAAILGNKDEYNIKLIHSLYCWFLVNKICVIGYALYYFGNHLYQSWTWIGWEWIGRGKMDSCPTLLSGATVKGHWAATPMVLRVLSGSTRGWSRQKLNYFESG